MKITAGLGSVDDYIALVRAGADEVFCGYVPYKWNKKYGNLFPLNRREVLYYNVQISSLEDMKILKKMVDVYKVPVSITFNYLYYLEEQYEIIAETIKELMDIGFNDFIIADIALLLYLKEKDISFSIHLSGECAEINRLSIDFFNMFNVSRYIFHRKNLIEDMKDCIKSNKMKKLEYEAFILNERCHYTGAFCNSLHCDEMIHLCKMPYKLCKVNKNDESLHDIERKYKLNYEKYKVEDSYMLGSTGCGLCYLQKLNEAGITHLKVVGRGNSIVNMEKDVQNLKRCLKILEEINQNEVFQDKIKKDIFHGNCSGLCYY